MSAEVNLAGLYSPENNQIWNSFLLWQPIPVHTQPVSSDYLIGGGVPSSCTSYQKAYNKYLGSDDMKLIEARYQKFYGILSANMGATVNNLMNITLIRDSWLCESVHKLS